MLRSVALRGGARRGAPRDRRVGRLRRLAARRARPTCSPRCSRSSTRFEARRLSEFLPLVLLPIVVFWVASLRLRASARTGSPGFRRARAGRCTSPCCTSGETGMGNGPAWGRRRSLLGALAFLALRRALAIAGRAGRAALHGGALRRRDAALPDGRDSDPARQGMDHGRLGARGGGARLARDARPRGRARPASAALAGAAFVRLLLNPALWSYHPRGAERRSSTGISTRSAFRRSRSSPRRAGSGTNRGRATAPAAAAAASAAGVVLFVLVNVEIADFYSTGAKPRFRLWAAGSRRT